MELFRANIDVSVLDEILETIDFDYKKNMKEANNKLNRKFKKKKKAQQDSPSLRILLLNLCPQVFCSSSHHH